MDYNNNKIIDRVEIKSSVKSQMKGKFSQYFLGVFAPYFLIAFVIGLLTHTSVRWTNLTVGSTSGSGLSIVCSILVIGPLFIGIVTQLLKAVREDNELTFKGPFVAVFNKEKYFKAVGVTFYEFIFGILWTLLFIIPGLVKRYSYSMAKYIIVDNPEIKPLDAITASRKLMDGNKAKLFFFQLSFILWWIGCIFTCGILLIRFFPYYSACEVEFYRKLIKEN